mgnify:CR=1 FL=1
MLAGWASNSKYAFLGGCRSVAQESVTRDLEVEQLLSLSGVEIDSALVSLSGG